MNCIELIRVHDKVGMVVCPEAELGAVQSTLKIPNVEILRDRDTVILKPSEGSEPIFTAAEMGLRRANLPVKVFEA